VESRDIKPVKLYAFRERPENDFQRIRAIGIVRPGKWTVEFLDEARH